MRNIQITIQFHFPTSVLLFIWRSFTGFTSPAVMDDPIVIKLREKYGKTPAQILLRHLIQLGIIPIPTSSNLGRLMENFKVRHVYMNSLEIILVIKSVLTWIQIICRYSILRWRKRNWMNWISWIKECLEGVSQLQPIQLGNLIQNCSQV